MESTNILYIKNMVCPRCIKVVKDELEVLRYNISSIELGKVVLSTTISEKELQQIGDRLIANGFELLDDRKSRVIENVKILIIEAIHKGTIADMAVNFSYYLSEKLQMEYSHLSNLFSAVEGKSIERYLISQKIERIKELISYDELSVKQIADQLGYSSLQALSGQFKKETGMTPTEFKKLSGSYRRGLDEV